MKGWMGKYGLKAADLFAALCAAFALSSIAYVMRWDFSDLNIVRQSKTAVYVLICATAFALLIVLSCRLKTNRIIAAAQLVLIFLLAVILAAQNPGDVFFNLGLGAVLVLSAKYAADGDKLCISQICLSKKCADIITAVSVAAFVAAVFFFTALKYKSYSHGTYDFGIFAQMFEQMAKTGLPVTTVERAGAVSHFAVHFSPIFYALLPGYFLFRSPLYLLFVQAAAIGFGAFPIRRICRELGLSEKMSLAAAALYLLFPTMANGAFYDFHENKLLSVLILYAVWLVLKKNRAGAAVFSLLVLFVKEDAFVYVLAIAVWMLVTGRDRPFAAFLAVFSVLYFVAACGMITLCGGEIMSGRFENLYAGNGGLLDAVKTCFVDVGYLFREVFSGADTEKFRELTYSGQKLEFVLWTGTPLLFMPFLHKKTARLTLLLPMLIINLVPSWPYQFNPDYQYTYGTAALMLFSAVLLLSEISAEKRRFFTLSAFLVSALFLVSLAAPKAARYAEKYCAHAEEYKETDRALEENIPNGASVTAYGFIMPHLSRIDDLHTCPLYYGEYEKTDFFVVDTRYENDGHTEKMYEAMGDDYSLAAQDGIVKIYKRETKTK